ncbi:MULTISPECIES: RagB/SusD family nutrient uptake outer membrane protein [Shewanella]|uniref:RagB/SusD family nutrient uptake outer membrane protein n=2 Tax=Shewanellaceae TaxID=267890 RepID=UPI000C451499|nr:MULTISPECIES: RagB/SusD family nutrient uptake outer membrane protein [Shewanella]NCQ45965.1 RagB/SusD family nutrient uptake outer membrane protein [Shewanella frigidimarina]NCO72022.1 RagB/SusD family nutrient uptake outer membrane protein [Shewanella vesiculosa]NCP36505.1 RagB/SusD family nutrient uptake outer membrane protein [Shewanella vesiculosa]NCP69786.1 RagB/SusD family nutrient uptake outer membrane protein [Shewanella vesiculosa]NCP75470.1 RagB/SusD family nutrient uptake outer 
MNKIKTLFSATTFALFLASCGGSDLDVAPSGVLTEEQVSNSKNVDALIIAAYSYLGNDHYTAPNFLWPTGNLRAGDAHKGGNGPGDIFAYHALSLYQPVVPDMESFPPDLIDLNNKKWVRNYTGISRVNSALAVIANAPDAIEDSAAKQSELRFIRSIFYFDLKIHHKHIPWIDETMTQDQILLTTNSDLSDQELWDKIAADFEFAANHLPQTQKDVGRASALSAKAYLAKALLYQAYEQNELHQVININKDKLVKVVALVNEIEQAGVYGLFDDYANNFLFESENGKESVFAIQRSLNDGSPDGRGSWPSALNAPLAGGFGCCGFHVPTENFVNAFKTDQQGLPLFDTFNDFNYDKVTDAVDPRLDHTVAMEGKPFKYDENLIHGGDSWARAPGIYGNFTAMKDLEHPDCSCRGQNGPFPIFSLNTPLIRYADVLLWKAEALIELDRYDEALPIINRIRERAKNSTGKLHNASIYNIGSYTSFVSKEQAREALRFERRLELGLEGHRFFDLVRWGIAKETIDSYLAIEALRKPYLADAVFTKGRDEYLPIPNQQMILSGGLYTQNPGY